MTKKLKINTMKNKLETIAIWVFNLALMFAYVWNILINIV